MSDAEKYAKVFRAAADGIANSVCTREQHAENIWYRSQPYEEVVRRWLTGYPGDGINASHQGDPYRLGMWMAYRSMAEMFEKIVEAEAAARLSPETE